MENGLNHEQNLIRIQIGAILSMISDIWQERAEIEDRLAATTKASKSKGNWLYPLLGLIMISLGRHFLVEWLSGLGWVLFVGALLQVYFRGLEVDRARRDLRENWWRLKHQQQLFQLMGGIPIDLDELKTKFWDKDLGIKGGGSEEYAKWWNDVQESILLNRTGMVASSQS